jgi:hypothetical protein
MVHPDRDATLSNDLSARDEFAVGNVRAEPVVGAVAAHSG